MRKVFKYNLKVADKQQLELPIGATILTFDMQRERPVLWALVDPELPTETRMFRMAGTGHAIDGALSHIGTSQLRDGGLVLHLFEILPTARDEGMGTERS